MRWDFGKVYKDIRKSKGLTQNEVCGGELARSTLANIEAGKAVPNVENMIFLLNQVDMNVEEFRYICNYYHPSQRQIILSRIQGFVTSPSISEIQDLIKVCEDYLKIRHDLSVKNWLSILKIFYYARNKGIYQENSDFQKLTKDIWNYLDKHDTWYMSDFKLLNAILFHIPLDALPHIVNRIMKSLKKYENFSSIYDIQIGILTNLSTIYFSSGVLDECEKITIEIISLAKKLKRYDALAFLHVRLGICRKDRDLVDKGLTLLRLTEEHELLKAMEREVSQYF